MQWYRKAAVGSGRGCRLGCVDSANVVGCRSTFKKLDVLTTEGLFDMRSMLLTASRCTSICLSDVLSCTPFASPMYGAGGLDVFALPMKRLLLSTESFAFVSGSCLSLQHCTLLD